MRLGAGPMDREIDLKKVVPTTDELGAPVEGAGAMYEQVQRVWAAYKPLSGDEKKEGAETRATVDSAFTIYHRDDIAAGTHALVYGTKLYDILFVEEVGRREGLRLKCILRDANHGTA